MWQILSFINKWKGKNKMLTDMTAETGIGKRDVLLKTGIT